MSEVDIARLRHTLFLRHGRRRVELLAATPVRAATLSWLVHRLEALKQSRPDPHDPELRRRVRAVVERAPTG
jgi:hypothetical protein